MGDVAAVLDWFRSSGGFLDPSVGFTVFSDCGRGAVALQDISEGHVLFKIPREIILSADTSDLPRRIGMDRWRDGQMHTGWVGLILCMMWETAQGSDSRWSKYLESLPATFDTPMFWSDLELKELDGTSVVGKLGKADAERDFKDKLLPMVESRPDIFPAEKLPIYYTLEIYHVMGSRILSRSFDVEKDDPEEEPEEDGAPADTSLGSAMDVDEPQDEPKSDHDGASEPDNDSEDEEEPSGVAMVPLADMLNARYGSENAKLFYEKDDLRMVTTKLIKTGEQIWNTYGDLPNAELLRRYGHVDMLPLPTGEFGNPGDVVEISADLALAVLQGDEAVTKERIDWWLEQGGDDVFVLESDLEVPLALISLIRLLGLTTDEWEKAVTKDKVPKPKLDNQILKAVTAVFERRLNEYPTTLSDDVHLIADETLPLNKKHALTVRIGEKRILQSALENIKAQRQSEARKGDSNRKRKTRPDEEAERTSKTRRH
ncbi:SET domain-containing protein [Mycena galericulata]|nr:SET domain-containing protein [Mycena galericulata]